MFDGVSSSHPYGKLGPKHVCSPSNQQLALDAARQGIVLLKNRHFALPLSADHHRTVAVIGPNSDVNVTMIGNYAGKLRVDLNHWMLFYFDGLNICLKYFITCLLFFFSIFIILSMCLSPT